MRFAIRDLFAFTLFIALLAGVNSLIQRFQIPALILLSPLTLIVSGLGILALIVGAREKKAREDDQQRNSRS